MALNIAYCIKGNDRETQARVIVKSPFMSKEAAEDYLKRRPELKKQYTYLKVCMI